MKLTHAVVSFSLIAFIAFGIPVAACEPPTAVTIVLNDTYSYKNASVDTLEVIDVMNPAYSTMSILSTEGDGTDLKTIATPTFRYVTRAFSTDSATYEGHTISIADTESTVDWSDLPAFKVYNERTVPTIFADVPGECGNPMVVMVPEDISSSSLASIDTLFNSLETGYLFNEDAIIFMDVESETVRAFGAISSSDYDTNDITYTLNHNEVSLTDFSADSSYSRGMGQIYADTIPEDGKYNAYTINLDDSTNTVRILAAYPVIFLDGNTRLTWSGTAGTASYDKNPGSDITLSFEYTTGIEYISYALLKSGTSYDIEVEVDVDLLTTCGDGYLSTASKTAYISDVLENIANQEASSPFTYSVSAVGGSTTPSMTYSDIPISGGYGISGHDADASVVIPKNALNSLGTGTFYVYAMGLDADFNVIALDQTTVTISSSTGGTGGTGGSGGSGGSSGGPTGALISWGEPVQPEEIIEFTTTGTLTFDSEGTLETTTKITSKDGAGTLTIGRGTQVLDANGTAVEYISIVPCSVEEWMLQQSGGEPDVVFMGRAFQCTPEGTTFNPPIEITFTLTDEEWDALETDQPVIKWYNEETKEWEELPVIVDPASRTVTAQVSHFSIFALFAPPVETGTEPFSTPEAEPTQALPGTEPDSTLYLVAFAALVIIAGAVAFAYYQKKNNPPKR